MMLRYYFRIWRSFVRYSLIRDMEFRGNFLVNILLGVIWIGYMVLILEVIFYHTTTIVGWTRAEALLLLGFWLLLIKSVKVFVGRGLRLIPFDITDGRFDFHLVKPLSTQFLVSFRYFDIKDLSDVLIALGIIVYASVKGEVVFTLWSIIATILLFACAFILAYSFLLFFESFSFWFFKIDNIDVLFDAFVRIGRFPTEIFTRTIIILFLTLIPITVLTNFPAQALLHRLHPAWVLYAIALTALIFFSVRAFWQFAVRRYSSASS